MSYWSTVAVLLGFACLCVRFCPRYKRSKEEQAELDKMLKDHDEEEIFRNNEESDEEEEIAESKEVGKEENQKDKEKIDYK